MTHNIDCYSPIFIARSKLPLGSAMLVFSERSQQDHTGATKVQRRWFRRLGGLSEWQWVHVRIHDVECGDRLAYGKSTRAPLGK
jgi:hypothetical protein